MRVKEKLSELIREAVEIPSDDKYAIFSDCHRGIGNQNDNYFGNEAIVLRAHREYQKEDFSYIEAGDGDELWENKYLEEIRKAHPKSFVSIDSFKKKYRTKGNHDRELNYPEALKMKLGGSKVLLIVHGNQGDWINDEGWKVGRFLTRYIWGYLEKVGFQDPTSASRAPKKHELIEKELIEWVKKTKNILICGHTHRARIEGGYVNCGSCIHPGCITNVEFENKVIRLVKWEVNSDGQFLAIGKSIIKEVVL